MRTPPLLRWTYGGIGHVDADALAPLGWQLVQHVPLEAANHGRLQAGIKLFQIRGTLRKTSPTRKRKRGRGVELLAKGDTSYIDASTIDSGA